MTKKFTIWLALFCLLLQQANANILLLDMHQQTNTVQQETQMMHMSSSEMKDCHTTRAIDHSDMQCCDAHDCNHCCISLSMLMAGSYVTVPLVSSPLKIFILTNISPKFHQLPFRPPIVA